MIVCQCGVVSSSEIANAVDAGARTVAEVCQRTGAAQKLRQLHLLSSIDRLPAWANVGQPRRRGQFMQPVDPRIVELLNEALTLELSVTNTSFLHGRMLDN